MKNTLRFMLLLLTAALCSSFVRAQDTDRPDPDMSDTPAPAYVIRGARVVTVSGAEMDNATVVISGGRISAVGSNAAAPSGAQEIDGRGLSVYPGMIDLGTYMGLADVSSVGATLDTSELGDMNPNVAVIWSVNPHSSHIDVTRVAGVTSALALPSGGIISGQAAL